MCGYYRHIKQQKMTLKEQLLKLASEKNETCVSISLNTHRTHPDNAKDAVMLKNLLKEAEKRVIDEFGKRPVAALLEKIENVENDIDLNHNLDSLHIFLSNNTTEIVKSAWPTGTEGVQISGSFALRSLIKSFNRSENYLLLVLSQNGVKLYEALNDEIVNEIRNEDFPFGENRESSSYADKGNDPKHTDDAMREFLNRVDKALVKVHNETELGCIVISTDALYGHLQHVADKPSVYLGFTPVDTSHTGVQRAAQQAWVILKTLQKERRSQAIAEMHEGVAKGVVLIDFQEIFQAALDGRGDLLIVHEGFTQAVRMKDERTFELLTERTEDNEIDDLTSTIAWEVLSKKGRVFFTSQEELKDLGEMVLKTRY
jgi:hypothetical protein